MNDDLTTVLQPPGSIVVVSYNTSEHIEACLLSLLELDYPQVEVIVVDNGSTDGSVKLVRDRFPDVEVVELADNRGFAGGASVGLFMASGEILAAVNPDVRLDRAWMTVMSRTLQSQDDIGVAGSKILYPDGRTIQHAGGMVHYPLATTEHIGRGEVDNGQYNHLTEVSFVTGAALAMRREVGHSLGFFDEDYFPMYYEDVDLCWRARRDGLQVIYQPRAIAYHKESVTIDRRSSRYFSYLHANRLRFVIKHYSPEQIMLDFLPEEVVRIGGSAVLEDREASLALLGKPVEGLEGGGPDGVTENILAALSASDEAHEPDEGIDGQPLPADLEAGGRDVAPPAMEAVEPRQEPAGQVAMEASAGEISAPAHASRDWGALNSRIGEVMSRAQVRAKPFTSSTPVLGGVIISLRQWLNNLSTRWYVQPILHQQVEYNTAVAHALSDISQHVIEIHKTTEAQLSELTRLVDASASDLARLVNTRSSELLESQTSTEAHVSALADLHWSLTSRVDELQALRSLAAQLSDLETRSKLQAMLTAGMLSRRSDTSIDELTAEIDALRARIEQLELMPGNE